jgi:hypothetical protein
MTDDLKGVEDMSNKGRCRECKYADWDADGCTCMIDGRSVYNASDYTCDQYRPAKPLTNADRIRKMTDEELADFFCKISQCCGNDACLLCPIFEGCAQNAMCVERWLKKEADGGADNG